MSSVDERIVRMVFDNGEFSNKISQTINSLNQLNKSTDQIAQNTSGLSAMGSAFQQAESLATKAGFQIRDVWLKVASTFEQQIASKIVNTSKQIANAMTFEGISDGFKEYELKMGSIQTIMAGTGESLKTVNKYLDELNTYSDKTIYSFADMTNNIGKFTNAGVKLEDAVSAIKGIANEAAISGANANEASRAMYNFSQALSAGYVKLIDWKSIENANMATKGFKDALLQVAETVGTVKKGTDGMYQVLGKNANGATMKETISATKNFNDSLAYQWMTTEVLTKTLKLYATDLTEMSKAEKEAFRVDLGMSEEQFAQFEELGHKATLAASEIKTFTMLIDTLKEAIGSGWAMTWQMIIGDFEQAKGLWTEVGAVLGGVIDAQSQYRNDTLKLWQQAGGRTDLVDALKNSFHALQAIIKPVSEGLRDVFPKYTYRTLKDISEGIKNFTAKLIITEETAGKVRHTFQGVFSIFDIGIKFVKAFVSALKPAGTSVTTIAGSLLDVTSNLGQFLYKLDNSITAGKTFEKVFSGVGNILTPVFEGITKGASAVLGFFSKLFASFSGAEGKVCGVSKIFSTLMKDISGGVDNLKTKFSSLKPFLSGLLSLAKGAGNVIGQVFKQLGDSLSGFSVNGNGITAISGIFNALLSGGILYRILNGAKAFGSLGEILDSFGETIEGFSKRVAADTLVTIAKGIAILAGSLLVVSMIDSNKLLGATTAITVMVGSLAGAMALLMKAVNSFSTTDVTSTFKIFGKDLFGSSATKMLKMAVTLKAVSKALIAMGAAILMMSVGLKVVSSAAEGGHLWDSFAVISLMLAELTTVAIVLGKFGGKATKGAENLKGMGLSLIMLSAALNIVAKAVEGGNAWEALGIISIMLAELTGVVLVIENFGKKKLSGMAGLISMAVSLNLVVFALKSVSDALGTEGNHILASLGIITILLTELTAAVAVMGQFGGFAVFGGIGAIMAAASLLILVKALKQVSDMLGQTDQHVWGALAVIGSALLILGLGLTAMTATIPGAAALLIASAALIVLGGALKIMGQLKVGEIAKSLITLTLALTLLAVGLTLMIVALPGATALKVASEGLLILAGALTVMGKLKLGELIKSLLAMTVALTAIATVTTVLSLSAPFMLAFSAALLVFGVSLMSTSVGITMFAGAMQSLVAIVPLGAAAISTLGTALLNLIPVLVESLMNALGILASKIVEYGPQFALATATIIGIILDTLGSLYLKIGETVLKVITGILTILAENTPKLAKAGADLMIAFNEALAKEIPRVVDSAYKCAIALVDGLASAIEKNNTKLIVAVDRLMNAVVQAITQWLVEFTPLGALLPEELKSGIMGGTFKVRDAFKEVLRGAIDAIKNMFTDFKNAAGFLIEGLIAGLKGTGVGRVVSAAASLGNSIVEGLKSKKGLDEHSPSVRGIEAGEFLGEGTIIGMKNVMPDAKNAAAELGGGIVESLIDPIKEGTEDAKDTFSDFEGGIKHLNELLVKGEIDVKTYTERYKELKANTADTAKETKKLTYELDQNQKVVKKSHGHYELVEEQIVDTMKAEGKLTNETEKNTEAVEANTSAQNENAVATGKSGKATKTHADLMKEASGVVDEFVKNYGHLYKELGEDAPVKAATFAIKKLAESTYEASLKAKDSAEENKKTKATIDDMVKSFTEMKKGVYDSVKSLFEGDNFFQKFELKTEQSMASVLENMRSNVNAVANWTTKIAELGNKGLNQGLLKQLAELGPKGFEYVNAFSTATTEQIKEANELFAQAGVLPESSSNAVVASYAQAGLNAVLGFSNGIDQNAGLAATSMTALGTNALETLENILEIHSPSRRTFRDGKYLNEGLSNGISTTDFLPKRAAVTLCNSIMTIFESNLSSGKFEQYGRNIAQGLANGLSSAASINAVRAAAEVLSRAAAEVTEKYNGIHSPARRYISYGGNMAKGLANGINNNLSVVKRSGLQLSNTVRDAVENLMNSNIDEMEFHPVVTPVLDLSGLRQSINNIGGIRPVQSLRLASSIGIGSYSAQDYNAPTQVASGAQINFTQNNYSPKPLSRYDIYRDTKNLTSMMRGVIKND